MHREGGTLDVGQATSRLASETRSGVDNEGGGRPSG
jgi:hypothetical protein